MESIEITTKIGCPVQCKYCPQDKLIANYKSDKTMMDFKDFRRWIDKVPTHVRVDFSGMCEPFLNKRVQ